MEAAQTVLITGCSRGIGLGLVKEYVSRGFQVIATCRTPSKATELNDFLTSHGQNPALSLDVASLESIHVCKAAIEKDFQSLDVLVNNAAISNKTHPEDPPTTTDPEEFDQIMHNNVTSVLNMTQAFLPLLKQSKKPRVINITAGLGSITLKFFVAPTAYKCSKTALNMLTKCFAEEVKEVIFVAMCPGWVQTDMGMGSKKDLKPTFTVEESAKNVVDHAHSVTEKDSGMFMGHDGATVPY